jgi:hypothetical protein
MRYRYCDTQKKYCTKANSLKTRHINTSYSKKLCKRKGTGTVTKQFKNLVNNDTGSNSSVIPLRSEPY